MLLFSVQKVRRGMEVQITGCYSEEDVRVL